MRIADVLRRKGDKVVTIRSDDTVQHLLGLLAEHGIGAVVVSDDDGEVLGIASERDIVRQLHSRGSEVITAPVSSIMTSLVSSCTPDTDLGQVEQTMTEQRIRHVPVLVDGRLTGIVSIGDVVKQRIEDLQSERDQLYGYIQQ